MIDPFERTRYIKNIVQMIYPKISHEELNTCIQRIAKHKYRKQMKLSEKESVICDLLLQHQIKPATAYLWYKVRNLPAYLQQEIRDRKLSMTEAFQKNLESNKPIQVLGEELGKEIQEYVNELAKRDFLRGDDYAIQ
ncbi:MAG: hypothetical protein V1866_04165 [archaeon]